MDSAPRGLRARGDPARARHDDVGPRHDRTRTRATSSRVPRRPAGRCSTRRRATATASPSGSSASCSPTWSTASEVVAGTKAGISRAGGERVVDASRGALLARSRRPCGGCGTDHVDLWLVHTWSDAGAARGDAVGARLGGESGRARYVGRLQLRRLADRRAPRACAAGRAPLVANADRVLAAAARDRARGAPAAAALGVGLLAWSPLGRGVLTGKYRTARRRPTRGRRRRTSPASSSRLPRRPRPAASSRRCTPRRAGWAPSPRGVALAWVRDRPGVTAPIVGARTPPSCARSSTAEDLELPEEIVARARRRVGELGPRHSHSRFGSGTRGQPAWTSSAVRRRPLSSSSSSVVVRVRRRRRVEVLVEAGVQSRSVAVLVVVVVERVGAVVLVVVTVELIAGEVERRGDSPYASQSASS